MNNLLFTMTIALTPVMWGSQTSAPKPPKERVIELVFQDPPVTYGSLIAARKFKKLDKPHCEVSLWGEAHNGFTYATFDDQRKAIDDYLVAVEQAKIPHVFLLELPPDCVEDTDNAHTPTRYVLQQLSKHKEYATFQKFDERSKGSRLLVDLSYKLFRIMAAEPPPPTGTTYNWKPAIEQFVKKHLAKESMDEQQYVKAIADTEKELSETLKQMIDANDCRPQDARTLTGYIETIRSHKLSSVTDLSSLVKALHTIAQASKQSKSQFYESLMRIALVYGDYFLECAFKKALKTHPRITVVGGAFHNKNIKELLPSPSWLPCKGFDWVDEDVQKDCLPLTQRQLREAFALPIALSSEHDAKQAEADVKGRAGNQTSAAAMPTPIADNKKSCHTCNKAPEKQLRCGKCKKVYYCNADCQRADWPKHKEVCGK